MTQMTTTTLRSHNQTPGLWAALKFPGPHLKSFTFPEGLRLSLIVGSLSFVILAGQYAQSRGQELSNEAAEQIVASAAAAERVTARSVSSAQSQRKITPLEKFAVSQVRSYGELLDGLTERAETVIATSNVSEFDQAQLKATLRGLDEDLMTTREALAQVQSATSKWTSKEIAFAEEDLRGSLLNLQASASDAQGQLIQLDRGGQTESVQVFKVSRIGQ